MTSALSQSADPGSTRGSEGMNTGRRREKRLSRVVAILATVAALALSVPSVAQAAPTYYWYARDAPADEFETLTSPRLSTIRGGTTAVSFSLGGVTLRMVSETFAPAPGYQTLYYTQGDGGTFFVHELFELKYQKCHWYFPEASVGGVASMDCGARR